MAQLTAATGISTGDLVPVPSLFWESFGYLVAYVPGLVNGISFADEDFGAPEPHGPVIDGKDPFKLELEAALGAEGITVHWLEDWDLYHRLDGEVHCASNATRRIPNPALWWEVSP
jgi:protein-arginine deiminase